jgi:predicted transcriptional regulator
MKKTLKTGIAPRAVIARHTRDVVAGRRRRTSDDPDIWFTSLDSCAQVMSERVSRGETVKTIILDVRDPGEAMRDFRRVWKTGKRERFARISFASPELLWKVLTAKRWELLKALCGAGPVSIREAARRVDRGVKAVHSDVTALLNAGVLDRAPDGGVVFPYGAVKVEFLFRAR